MATYTVTDGQSQSFSLANTNRDPQHDTISVSGNSVLDLSVLSGSNEQIAVALASGAHLTAGFHFAGLQSLDVGGDASTSLTLTGTSNVGAAAPARFGVDVSGPATLNVGAGGQSEFTRSVGSDVTVNLANGAGTILDQPNAFKGALNFNDGYVFLHGLDQATDYDLANGVLTIYGGPSDQALDAIRFADSSPEKTGLSVTISGGTVEVVEKGQTVTPTSNPTLAQHVGPIIPQAPFAYYVAGHDNVTNADLPDITTQYAGPVTGLAGQWINVTPDSLSLTALKDSLFIKTGSGDDAIALHGGTNVVDAGAGSNFLTSGSGSDTFFVDARAIAPIPTAAGPAPGSIWDTLANFHAGDAATLWGVSPGTSLVWQRDEGAVGHTGLTLHANMPNGSEASLTLAGIDSKAGLQLSYGSIAGSSYLYIKGA